MKTLFAYTIGAALATGSLTFSLLLLAVILVGVAVLFRIIPFGMTATIFDYTSYGKVDLLSERMRRQQFYGNKFAHFVAPNYIKAVNPETEVTSAGTVDKFTGAPIEIFEEFVKMGQVDMRIPVEQRLSGMPVHGDSPLEGTEEAQTLAWRTIRINRTRKAESIPTGMSKQQMKKYADSLVTGAERKLTQWWNDYHAGNFVLSMLAGASRDLVAASAQGGRSIGYVSHPNFFTAGAGQVSYAGGRPNTAGYEASVEAAINGLTNVAGDYFSVGYVRNIQVEARRLKIKPIVMKSGFEFYPLFIKDSQWTQLQNDTDFKEFFWRQMPNEFLQNPLSNGAQAVIGGIAIYVDLKMWGARTNAIDGNVTAGTVEYGPAPTAALRGKGYKVGNWINALDTADRAVAILLGRSCLSIGVGERMMLKENVEDYENEKGIGIDTIQSVVRNDIYDEDGQTGLTAGDFQENTSSLVAASYSPQSLSY